VARSAWRGALWLFTVGVLAIAAGGSLGTPVIARALLKAFLHDLLHPGSLEVRLEVWPPPALWWGRVDILTVLAHEVRIGDLQFQTFDATLADLRFDPGALYVDHNFVIQSVGAATAHATVSQDELARVLARQPGVRVDEIVLRPGQVFLRGAVRWLGAEVPAEATGRLVLNGSTAVDLILDHVTLTGGTVRGTLGTPSVLRLRSVISVPPLPFGFRLTGVRVDDGKVVLDAGT
jgi:hypothetical protein